MRTRTASLNGEKTFFLLSAAGLAAVLILLAGSRPLFDASGPQRTERGVPREVDLGAGRLADPDPAGRDPFSRAADRQEDREEKKLTDPIRKDRVLSLPSPVDPTRKEGPGPQPRPEPYRVPVNFMGVYGPPGGGELYVLLRDKRTGERRRLVRGEMWPEIDLRIVAIDWNSVLLENEKGKRFLMRDLMDRRPAGGGGPDAPKS
jgi:hypothetical protein